MELKINNDFIEEVKIFIKNNNMDDIFTEENSFFTLYNCNIYIYMRVSTDSQDFGRELIELYNWLKKKGIKVCINNIFCDKCTGKKLNRKDYQRLKDTIKENDYLLISNLNRLGRGNPNEGYENIKKEWYYYKFKDIKILIAEDELNEYISAPLPFEPHETTLNRLFLQDMIFVNTLYKDCLKLLEVSNTTKSGLIKAKMQGKQLGRPNSENSTKENLINTLKLINDENYSIEKALNKTRFPRASFFIKIREYKNILNTNDLNIIIKELEKGEII